MKRIVQDIIIRKKYAVKNGSVSLKKTEIYNENSKKTKPVYDLYNKPAVFGKKNNSSSYLIWIFSAISVIALFFVFSYVFSSAVISITPKSEKVSLNNTWPIISDTSADGLHFQVITIKKSLSKNLATDGDEYVERKSVGKAIVYNNYSAQSQRLINNTRLESLDGLIYRIRDSVEIPGSKIVNGVKTPGSAEIDIIADSAGDKYNMKLSDFKGDFKIPGFKGSQKYDDFYGRLSTDVTGGFIGKVKKVSEDKIITGREELKKALADELMKNLYSSLPEKNIIFKDNYFIQYNELPDESSGNDLKIGEEGVINGIAFDKNELAKFIANQKIKSFDGSNVELLLAGLSATIVGNTNRPWLENSLKVTITGDSVIVWKYEKSLILKRIAGKNKSAIASVLKENSSSIVSMTGKVSPLWFSKFPREAKKYTVIDSIRDRANK